MPETKTLCDNYPRSHVIFRLVGATNLGPRGYVSHHYDAAPHIFFLTMTRRKAAATGGADGKEPSTTATPKIVVTDSEPRDVIKVNNANLTELKHTLDDALKRVRSGPSIGDAFTPDM